MFKMPRPISYLLLALFVVQGAYFYPQMPKIVASHFGAGGAADGWSSKEGFFAFVAAFGGFIFAFPFLVMALIKAMPASFINLPNKDYWLRGANREFGLRLIREQFEWLGIGLAALLNSTLYLVFQSNLRQEALPGISWVFIAAFMAFTLGWSVRFHTKFDKLQD